VVTDYTVEIEVMNFLNQGIDMVEAQHPAGKFEYKRNYYYLFIIMELLGVGNRLIPIILERLQNITP
jgi:hypothetical protein